MLVSLEQGKESALREYQLLDTTNKQLKAQVSIDFKIVGKIPNISLWITSPDLADGKVNDVGERGYTTS